MADTLRPASREDLFGGSANLPGFGRRWLPSRGMRLGAFPGKQYESGSASHRIQTIREISLDSNRLDGPRGRRW